ncbi:hypothetical protein ACL02T_33060 [Pseudonocardia sp. RS010]|uniref:hypothetical protein n=1 Tax=Pseudonocardia sp. RS010 TaxID=3385979 RepID=UPI0039A0A2C9
MGAYELKHCPHCHRELKTTRGGRIPPHTLLRDEGGGCPGGRLFPTDDPRAGTEIDG